MGVHGLGGVGMKQASETSGSGSGSDSEAAIDGYSGPNYASIEIPSKSPEEMNYVERRAELLEQINSLGHPSMLNQREQAERYGVSQPTIWKDLKRLGEYVNEQWSDEDRQALATESVVKRSVRGLIEDEEWKDAAKTQLEWHEFVEERTRLAELEERLSRLEGRS